MKKSRNKIIEERKRNIFLVHRFHNSHTRGIQIRLRKGKNEILTKEICAYLRK